MAKTTRTMMRIQIHIGSLSLGNSRLYCAQSRSCNTRDRDGWFVPRRRRHVTGRLSDRTLNAYATAPRSAFVHLSQAVRAQTRCSAVTRIRTALLSSWPSRA
jgi:hypothetical protein